MSERKGNWMQTYSGRQFWPLDPRASDVVIEDIAHALSLQCRFAGHCRFHYSVAQHSVLVASQMEHMGHGGDDAIILAALLHDASEAYLIDVPRPVKPYLEEYASIERSVQHAVLDRFGVPMAYRESSNIKRADNILLATEQRDIMNKPPADWELDEAPSALLTIVYWTPEQAFDQFMGVFKKRYKRAAAEAAYAAYRAKMHDAPEWFVLTSYVQSAWVDAVDAARRALTPDQSP